MKKSLYKMSDMCQFIILCALVLALSYFLAVDSHLLDKVPGVFENLLQQLSKVRFIAVLLVSSIVVFWLYKVCSTDQKAMKIRIIVGDVPKKLISRFFLHHVIGLLVANILVLQGNILNIMHFETVVFGNLLILFYLCCNCLFMRNIIARQI